MTTTDRVLAFALTLGLNNLLFDKPEDGDAFIDLAKNNSVLKNVVLWYEWVGPENNRKIEVSVVKEIRLNWTNLSKYRVDNTCVVHTGTQPF